MSIKKPKSVSTFDFSTLHTIIPHKLLQNVLSEVINFVFKSKVRKRIGFSKTSIYRTSPAAGRRYFNKQLFANAMSFLKLKCFFTICNMVLKQDISIPMSINRKTILGQPLSSFLSI